MGGGGSWVVVVDEELGGWVMKELGGGGVGGAECWRGISLEPQAVFAEVFRPVRGVKEGLFSWRSPWLVLSKHVGCSLSFSLNAISNLGLYVLTRATKVL